jgi:hypothetical protein
VGRVLVVVLIALVMAFPVAAAPHAHATTMTIRLTSTTESTKTLVDKAPIHVASKGDVYRVSSLLRNAVAQFGQAKGAFVGSEIATFTFLSRTRMEVKADANLPGGFIFAKGRVRLGHLTYPVTGGSGRFAGARGTAESRALGPNSDRRLRGFRLSLP